MPQIIDIQRVDVGPRTLVARVAIAPDAPLATDADPEGTDRVVDLLPEVTGHACFGDAGATFGEVVYQTELAHLLEHVAVELIARTGLAGDVSAGRTRALDAEAGLYEVELDCYDDVLTAAALSSAAWVLDWAYSGGGDPTPDIAGIVGGLAALVASLDGEGPADDAEPPADDDAPFDGDKTIAAPAFGEDGDEAPEGPVE